VDFTQKILGQVAPAAANLTPLYTVPPQRQAVISSFTVCNRSGVATTFRASIAISGKISDDDISQYLYYDLPMPPHETFIASIQLTLTAGDQIRVYAADPTLTFQAFGFEQ